MKIVFYRIYYCLFKGLKRSFNTNDKTTAIISVMYYSILLFCNVVSISLLFTAITKIRLYRLPWHWSLVLFLIINSLCFLKNKNYSKIMFVFDREDNKTKSARKTLCVINIVISLISVPLLMYLIGIMGLYIYIGDYETNL